MTRLLVVAKSPVSGKAKTRLGAEVGMTSAAELAAAALLDVLDVATTTVGADACHLSLAGDLADGVRGEELLAAVEGWTIHPQQGGDFADRLAQAHAAIGPGPVVQLGMDTPQLTPALLRGVADALADHDAVLAPAADGGWWALALRDPGRARVLAGVPMSTPETYAATRAALESDGLRVADAPELIDVDTAADAAEVAAAAPHSRFAAAWALAGSETG